MSDHAFERAVEVCGGQAALARKLTEITGKEVTQQRIWNIINRSQKVPAELVLATERATAGMGEDKTVTRHDLRPDLYPVDDGVPLAQKGATNGEGGAADARGAA